MLPSAHPTSKHVSLTAKALLEGIPPPKVFSHKWARSGWSGDDDDCDEEEDPLGAVDATVAKTCVDDAGPRRRLSHKIRRSVCTASVCQWSGQFALLVPVCGVWLTSSPPVVTVALLAVVLVLAVPKRDQTSVAGSLNCSDRICRPRALLAAGIFLASVSP